MELEPAGETPQGPTDLFDEEGDPGNSSSDESIETMAPATPAPQTTHPQRQPKRRTSPTERLSSSHLASRNKQPRRQIHTQPRQPDEATFNQILTISAELHQASNAISAQYNFIRTRVQELEDAATALLTVQRDTRTAIKQLLQTIGSLASRLQD